MKVPEDIVENGCDSTSHDVKKKKSKLRPRQIANLIIFCFCQFCLAASVSLQGPFFPREAEKKGATATVYGLIFGSFELAALVAAPVFGKLVVRTKPKFLIVSGLFCAGSCSILFSFLDRSPPGDPFIGLAFACRIMEGVSTAAITTASYTALATEFPDRVATSFSLMETFFGLGLILGPTLGGVLYEVQGFPLPFQLMGSLLVVSAAVSFILIPDSKGEKMKTGDMWKFISDLGIILDGLSVTTALLYIGFFSATLEPYLRQFQLSPSIVGIIFVVSGGVYAITTPLWGVLCDRGFTPKLMGIFGYCLQCVSILLVGPAPFIPIQPKLWLIIVALVIGGLGTAAKVVSSFVGSLQDSLKRGFPNDITTHAMVSALFATSIPLGAFTGPSLGGILWDTVGFRMGTMVYFGVDVFCLLCVIAFVIWKKKQQASGSSETTPLLKNETIDRNQQETTTHGKREEADNSNETTSLPKNETSDRIQQETTTHKKREDANKSDENTPLLKNGTSDRKQRETSTHKKRDKGNNSDENTPLLTNETSDRKEEESTTRNKKREETNNSNENTPLLKNETCDRMQQETTTHRKQEEAINSDDNTPLLTKETSNREQEQSTTTEDKREEANNSYEKSPLLNSQTSNHSLTSE